MSQQPHICYALTCGNDDYYAQMTYISASLVQRLYPNRRIVLLVDEVTDELLRGRDDPVLSVIKEMCRVETGSSSQSLRSRFLKTTLRQMQEGPFVFLDADTAPVRPFDEFLDCGADFAAVQNRDAYVRRPGFSRWAGTNIFQPMGWSHPLSCYFNSGVMYMADNAATHRLAARWHTLWKQQVQKIAMHQDQAALNVALQEVDVTIEEFGPPFNAVVEYVPSYARDARILHYFASAQGGRPRRETLLGHLLESYLTTGEIDFAAVDDVVRRNDGWVRPIPSIRYHLARRNYTRAMMLIPPKVPGALRLIRDKALRRK